VSINYVDRSQRANHYTTRLYDILVSIASLGSGHFG